MRTRTILVTRAILFATAGLPAFRNVAAAIQCESRTSTKAEVPVYSAVPQFSTARGWELGPVIATLPPGARIICLSLGQTSGTVCNGAREAAGEGRW